MAPPPIVTITLNPTLDEAVSTGVIALGGLNRVALDGLDPGGKGINASRVMHRLGYPTLALGFAGGYTGTILREDLEREGVPFDFVDVDGLTRINVMIYESALGRRTRMYLPGPAITPANFSALREKLARLPDVKIVVIGGSLPPGLAPDTYRDLVTWLRQRSIRTILDASGAALEIALEAHPFLIKPNLDELTELVGTECADDRDVIAAARLLRRRGAQNVVISFGAGGAIAVGPGGIWKAIPPPIDEQSTVGSGDSMIAGLAIGIDRSGSLLDGLRLGTAAGAATAQTPGTRLGTASEIQRLLRKVRIEEPAPVARAKMSGA